MARRHPMPEFMRQHYDQRLEEARKTLHTAGSPEVRTRAQATLLVVQKEYDRYNDMLLIHDTRYRDDKRDRTERYLQFRFGMRQRYCLACFGSGKYDDGRGRNCSSCEGTGREWIPGPKRADFHGQHAVVDPRGGHCRNCGEQTQELNGCPGLSRRGPGSPTDWRSPTDWNSRASKPLQVPAVLMPVPDPEIHTLARNLERRTLAQNLLKVMNGPFPGWISLHYGIAAGELCDLQVIGEHGTVLANAASWDQDERLSVLAVWELETLDSFRSDEQGILAETVNRAARWTPPELLRGEP